MTFKWNLVAKHLFAYLLTCILGAFLIPVIMSIFMGKPDISIAIIALPLSIPIAVCFTAIPYMIAISLIKFTFKTESRIGYILMGIFCASSILVLDKHPSYILKEMPMIASVILSGILSGYFYSYRVKRFDQI